MALSQWCADETLHRFEILTNTSDNDISNWVSEPVWVNGHQLCVCERWHDRSHTDCCAGANELESWACTCDCHAGNTGRRMT